MLCFFTIASAKRDDYILYAIPPFAIVMTAPFARVAASANRASVRLSDIASSVAASAMLLLATADPLYTGTPTTFFGSRPGCIQATLRIGAFIAATEDRTVRIELTLFVIAITSVSALYLVFKQNGHAAALSIALAELAALSL